MEKINVLKSLRFGERIAEEELNELEKYFVATDQWNLVFSGEVDIVYGAKGSGKSAIFALLDKRKNDLFDKNIITQGAENIRGNTAFADLIVDPPPSERAFIDLWKLYLLIICASAIREYGVKGKGSDELVSTLTEAGLLSVGASLGQMFNGAKKLVWAYIFPERESVEYTLAVEPSTGLPVVTRKTTFALKQGSPEKTDMPLDELLAIANQALLESDFSLWILFDRLDVAFNDTPEVERNALRALFRTYNDFKGFDALKLKIFVRDDIWVRISEGGFAEASHITKTATIDWSYENLLNLFVRRLVSNESILEFLEIKPENVVDDFENQKVILTRIFPDKVETGNNPETFRWMVNRIQDASQKPAPRELIHLSECIRRLQVARLERGEVPPEGEQLFERLVFKPGLSEVSEVRYRQTFVAENPSLAEYSDSLKQQKAEQNSETLGELWQKSPSEAVGIAERLVKSGFFEKRTTDGQTSYWVPFIYRDALELVQGKSFE